MSPAGETARRSREPSLSSGSCPVVTNDCVDIDFDLGQDERSAASSAKANRRRRSAADRYSCTERSFLQSSAAHLRSEPTFCARERSALVYPARKRGSTERRRRTNQLHTHSAARRFLTVLTRNHGSFQLPERRTRRLCTDHDLREGRPSRRTDERQQSCGAVVGGFRKSDKPRG